MMLFERHDRQLQKQARQKTTSPGTGVHLISIFKATQISDACFVELLKLPRTMSTSDAENTTDIRTKSAALREPDQF